MPDALEFAQWQGEQRAAASQRRLVAMAQLRQEAARKREQEARNQQFATELMFKAQEGERDRAAALDRTLAAGSLDIEQEEVRAKALFDRMDMQEKSKLLKNLEQNAGPRLPGETDEQYYARGNQAIAKQAEDIFANVDDQRKRALTVAQREAGARAGKIDRMAMQTVASTLSKAEQAAISANPAAFQLILQKNPAVASLYNSTVSRLEEVVPPISPAGAIELQGLDDEAKRWEKVGADLVGSDAFAGARQYFVRQRPKQVAPRASLVPAPATASPTGASVLTPGSPVAPPELSNFAAWQAEPLQGLIPSAMREIGGVASEINESLIQPPLRAVGNSIIDAYRYLFDPRVPSFRVPPTQTPAPEFSYPAENPPRAFRSPYPPYVMPGAPIATPPEFQF